MQEGYSLDAICAGLCEGIARNVLDVLLKGRELSTPVGVVGGVSLNKSIVNVIQDILQRRVVVPEHAPVAGAVGAALLGSSTWLKTNAVLKKGGSRRHVRIPLEMRLTQYPDLRLFSLYNAEGVEVFLPTEKLQLDSPCFMGIDIGSTSTKAVLLDERGDIKGGFYTRTGGEPIQAVQNLLGAIESCTGGRGVLLRGVATTGSGRKLIAGLFSAEMELDEITAHARAAVFLNPEVDTIIEIGGQDSKFTRIREGDVFYSTMNYVCAAGTGSFIEEQAKRLGVSLDDFSDLAFNAQAPFTSDRCTVYMERDLDMLLAEGWSKKALAAAVLNSVRDNYLAKVVGKSPVGDYVVFQGATARNRALVASFEQLLQKPMHVSPYCHLTGALGAALICLEEGFSTSGFLWNIGEGNLGEEVCRFCTNHCILTVVDNNGTRTGWGMKCGRDYAEGGARKRMISKPEKRFHDYVAPFLTTKGVQRSRNGTTIGIPNALYNLDYFPLWHLFLSSLGFEVTVTKPSRASLAQGKKIVNSDFCAPMILSHGYTQQLIDEEVDYLFYPALVNEKDPEWDENSLFREKTKDNYFCYYSQYLPTIIGKLTAFEIEKKLISPLIHFNSRTLDGTARAIYESMSRHFDDLTADEVNNSFQRAYERFVLARENRKEVFEQRSVLPQNGNNIRIALMGRPYVLFDPVLNLGIPARLEELGAELYWQDEFNLDGFQLTYAQKYYERMHWHYGRKIIELAEYCARTDNLYALYLTCFRCSPDSFLISYVRDIMARYDKPFLILQLDELSSDTGYATRIEAGLRSFKNHLYKKSSKPAKQIQATRARNDRLEKGDTVLIPYLDRLISRFWVNCFTLAGHRALLLDAGEDSLNTGSRYTSGGECLPIVSIAGSVVNMVRNAKLDPEKTFLYIPTVCLACNFPQFPILSDLVFESAGLTGLKIGLINSMSPGKILPQKLSIKMFQSYILGCIIYKMYNRIKPYEIEEGITEKVFCAARDCISGAILSGRDLRAALTESAHLFRGIERDESGGRKARIGLIGDLYVKYNEVMNRKIQTLVEELGGELIIPSMTEYPFHFYDADIRLHGDDPRYYRILRTIEQRYEKVVEDIIDDQMEPDFAECVDLMKEYKIDHYIAGETSINVGRALYYISHGSVDAILHINPMFCCPGVVTSSIYRKIQEDFGIPIIDIFYDGTGNPNNVLIPHMHYLKQASG
jgi:predicted CoA-substrate-specific enzyme activase